MPGGELGSDFNFAAWATAFQQFPGGAPKVVNISLGEFGGDCENAANGSGSYDIRLQEWLNFLSSFPDTVFVTAAGNCYHRRAGCFRVVDGARLRRVLELYPGTQVAMVQSCWCEGG